MEEAMHFVPKIKSGCKKKYITQEKLGYQTKKTWKSKGEEWKWKILRQKEVINTTEFKDAGKQITPFLRTKVFNQEKNK